MNISVADSVREYSPDLKACQICKIQIEQISDSTMQLPTRCLSGSVLDEKYDDTNADDPLNGPAVLAETSGWLHRATRRVIVTKIVAIVDAHRILPSCGNEIAAEPATSARVTVNNSGNSLAEPDRGTRYERSYPVNRFARSSDFHHTLYDLRNRMRLLLSDCRVR